MKWIAGIAPLLVLVSVRAQINSPAARELTVRLFSTAPVRSVSIEAESVSMRLCDVCRQTQMPRGSSIPVSAANARVLHVGSQSARQVLLDGELNAVTVDGRRASGAGKWMLRPSADGLHLTLTVPSERYVMAVLQSEAGPDDGVEALNALAVVARSYALTHPDRHGVEGLCDSTHCQAARMAPVPPRIRDAALATAGETLWFGGERVDGYFTQSCGGRTADASEVWGGTRKPWLVSHGDPYCQRQPLQWHANISAEELLRALRNEGFHPPSTVDALRIVARDSSGRAAMLELSGRAVSKFAIRASALRFAINRALGWNRLRSDWYSIHNEGRSLAFDGRGYGHGVGLCQAGAAEMARQGKGYREVLAFYFPGTQVRIGAAGSGWRTEQESGWTLRTARIDPQSASAGNAAWAEARSRWGVATVVHPVVTVAPDTELFRQLTNQPGWALASTSGVRVTLQPLAVVKAHGGVESLLLHEFLHVLVESEAGGSAPLWLREGLVEVLAGEHDGAAMMNAAQIESALQNASSLRQAQEAHRAAGALVRKLIARYGLGEVRSWLRNGVPPGVLAGQQP